MTDPVPDPDATPDATNIIIGMLPSGEPDLEALKLNGLRDIVEDTDDYKLLKKAILKANSYWHEKTKRIYGQNIPETKPFRLRKSRQEFELPAFQNRNTDDIVVERKVGKTYVVVPRDQYEPDKITEIRGDLDTLTHDSSWQPARYRITALWGELHPPKNIEEDIYSMIGFWNTILGSPLGLGTQYEMHGDIPVEKMMPRHLWQSVRDDKAPSATYIRRR